MHELSAAMLGRSSSFSYLIHGQGRLIMRLRPVSATSTNTPIGPTPAAIRAPAWAPWTAYASGQLVTYNGVVYRCMQGHTSQPGWEPPNVLALWQPQS